jgi:hypothetical protein
MCDGDLQAFAEMVGKGLITVRNELAKKLHGDRQPALPTHAPLFGHKVPGGFQIFNENNACISVPYLQCATAVIREPWPRSIHANVKSGKTMLLERALQCVGVVSVNSVISLHHNLG